MKECSRCGNKFTAGDLLRMPVPDGGDVVYGFCFRCGHILAVDSGELRELTVEEFRRLRASGELAGMRIVQGWLREVREKLKVTRRHYMN